MLNAPHLTHGPLERRIFSRSNVLAPFERLEFLCPVPPRLFQSGLEHAVIAGRLRHLSGQPDHRVRAGRGGAAGKVSLPPSGSAYSDIVTWIAGTARDHPAEIFTTNYDLLTEEALGRQRTGGLPVFREIAQSRHS